MNNKKRNNLKLVYEHSREMKLVCNVIHLTVIINVAVLFKWLQGLFFHGQTTTMSAILVQHCTKRNTQSFQWSWICVFQLKVNVNNFYRHRNKHLHLVWRDVLPFWRKKCVLREGADDVTQWRSRIGQKCIRYSR